MCVRQLLVRSLSQFGAQSAFVPCGRCEECRDSKKMQWTFRLRCELDWCRRQKWNIGFFTLTYDDEHLPYICDSYYATEADVPERPVACFSRSDVRTFIDNIRKRLFDLYRVKSLRYMVCSEYGSSVNTMRPHYHGLISFPPECDSRKVFELVHSQWKKGFVFPRYYGGGTDRHGYSHKPFLIQGDTQGAAAYAAKYCCKDLNFYKSLGTSRLVERDDPLFTYLKDCLPFHIQSRSIGKSYLSSLSDKDILRLLREGESFVGTLKKVSLPLYIRNKILYNPKYCFVERTVPNQPPADWWYDFECDKWRFKKGEGTHFRQVTKEPSRFMLEHYDTIYAQKKEYYRQFFKDISSLDYWKNRGCVKGASRLVNELSRISDLDRFTDYFIAYRGVKKDCWYSSVPARQWLLRYTPNLPKPRLNEPSFVFKDEVLFDRIINNVCTHMEYLTKVDKAKRERIARIRDFYKHSA